jgi:NADH dehydrogenase
MAEREIDPVARRRWLTFVVIGAGPTGVELAGQIAELSRRSLGSNYRRIDPADARIVLLDAAPTILGAFPQDLRERAVRDLRDMGVEIHAGTTVTNVDRTGIETSSVEPPVRRIDAATKIWAAGVEASPLGRVLANATRVKLDRAGRVKVEPDCSLPQYPEVFVIGDLMSLEQLPGVTQVAIQSGRHVAGVIARRVDGDLTSRPFRYNDPGTMATISRLRAVARIGTVHTTGAAAWGLWLVVRLMALTGFKTRLSVLFNWTIAFLGRARAERVITAQQVFARHALDGAAASRQIRNHTIR